MIRIYLLYLCPARLLYRECVCQSLSHVRLFLTPWTVVRQVPLSMELSRQEYWSGLPCPALAGMFFTSSATWEAHPGHTKKTTNGKQGRSLVLKCTKNLNGYFTKENIQIANNYERGLTSLVIMKMHIKIVLGIPLDIHQNDQP